MRRGDGRKISVFVVPVKAGIHKIFQNKYKRMTQSLPYTIHRSSVNAWECDDNGHLNVRHFIGKNYQGLIHLLAEIGLTQQTLRAHGWRMQIASQHIRFHREARMAMPIAIYGQLVAQRHSRLVLYTELRHSQMDTLFTSFNSEIDIVDVDNEQAGSFDFPLDDSGFQVPEHGAVRSLHAEEIPAMSVSEALAMGYEESGRGTVMAEECDPDGAMEFYQYGARVADAIPNFMSTIQSEAEFALRGAGELGGAVIESRADYYSTLSRNSRFVILSGVRSFAAKTKRLSHLIFDLDTGLPVTHSQGIAVALDLRTRRAVPFSEDRIERMQARLLKAAD